MVLQDLRLLRHSVETLGKGGMEKQWCLDVRRKLRDAKRYCPSPGGTPTEMLSEPPEFRTKLTYSGVRDNFLCNTL